MICKSGVQDLLQIQSVCAALPPICPAVLVLISRIMEYPLEFSEEQDQLLSTVLELVQNDPVQIHRDGNTCKEKFN